MPVGIRFRMYSQATTAGVMVTWATRIPTGSGGLPQPAVIVVRTACTWAVAFSTPRIAIVKPTGLLSATRFGGEEIRCVYRRYTEVGDHNCYL